MSSARHETPSPCSTDVFSFRDGDVVAIRASADGEDLIIKDNHSLDTTAPSQSAASEVPALDL